MASCSACHRCFFTDDAFAAHLWSKEACVQGLNWAQWNEHKARETASERAKPYYCPLCPYRTDSWNALEAHRWHCGKSADEKDEEVY